MNQSSRQPDLSIESFRGGGRDKLRAENFESDIAIALEIAGKVNDRHSSEAELASNPIARGEIGVQGVD